MATSAWPPLAVARGGSRAFTTMTRVLRALADYLEALPGNAATVLQPGQVPTIVLTPPNWQCEIPEGADHRIATGSGHWIQLDEPELVAAAIRDALTA